MSSLLLDTRLSHNFHGSEAFVTTRTVNNDLPVKNKEKYEANIVATAGRLEHIRTILGNKPISIHSWYRSPALNTLVGGSKNSDHMTGSAVDFICPGFGNPLQICKELEKEKHGLPFKQLIFEHTWVHISFDFEIPYIAAKRQVLTLMSNSRYAIGITDKLGNKV